jgi:acetyl esterase/lipase
MNIKFFAAAIFTCCVSIIASAQQSNLNEDYSAYLPEVRTLNKLLHSIPPAQSILTKEGLDKSRAGMKAYINTNTVLKPIIKNIPGPGGNIALYIYKPDTMLAVVLDIHGGGWLQGSALNDAQINDVMARTCHVAVVSVEYRLAPENPFPACIEDCRAAAKWLVNNEQKEFGTDKIFVSGNSAGGHLAAVTTLYIRDSLNAINRVKGVNLVYGVYDLGRTPSERLATDSSFLTKKDMAQMMQVVFGNWTTEQLQQPQYSPLYADLHNLPPALFTVGAADPLADDTYFMEARWRMAGNKTYLAVYPESGHGVDILPTQMARLARDKMHQWIIDLLKQ